MQSVIAALLSAFGQLTDPAVLKVLAKTVAVTIFVFIALAIGLYYALIWVGMQFGWSTGGWAEAAAAVLGGFLAFWLLFRVVALAVLQLFADEIVAAVEARHYPVQATTAKPLPLHREIANSLRGAGRALLYNLIALPLVIVLLVTGVGAALVFLLVNALLLGRELTDMAWLRHCDGDLAGNPVSKAHRFMLGAAIAALMLVPFVNLLAPVIGAAAGTHVMHGAREWANTDG